MTARVFGIVALWRIENPKPGGAPFMISDAAAILGQLTKLGCPVTARGDTLRVEASGAVPAELLQAAREHKADLLELVAGAPPIPPGTHAGSVHPLLLLPLDAFAAHGQPIEVRVPWWAQ